jgi:hypothetical protein
MDLNVVSNLIQNIIFFQFNPKINDFVNLNQLKLIDNSIKNVNQNSCLDIEEENIEFHIDRINHHLNQINIKCINQKTYFEVKNKLNAFSNKLQNFINSLQTFNQNFNDVCDNKDIKSDILCTITYNQENKEEELGDFVSSNKDANSSISKLKNEFRSSVEKMKLDHTSLDQNSSTTDLDLFDKVKNESTELSKII